MNPRQPGFFIIGIILLICCSAGPGCTDGRHANLTSAEIHSMFLENAGNIHDYRSEFHFSKPDGKASYDWKEPGYFRLEYLESERPAAGTLYVMNRTTGVAYNGQEKKFVIQPDMRYLREYDYQNMVLRIVQSKEYTVIGKMEENGRVLYGIEIVTEPWSTAYTTYVSSKVVAWIDPASGLTWNISTYYPSDTLHRNIRYDRIEVNTGIPDNHFIFNPPQESAIQCGSDSGISAPDQYDPRNISPALKPGCLDCTGMLLTKPVGGFSGDYLLVGMVDYTGTGRKVKTDPHRSVNYTFYSRNMSKGTVRYTISRVAGLYRTEPLPATDAVTLTIGPDTFTAEPGREYISEMTARVKPGTELHENFWIHLHADVEGVPDAITDDWIRLALDDGGTMSGAGLWHFYQSGGGYCQKVLVVPQGGSGTTRFAIRTAELDTGNAALGLVAVPCDVGYSTHEGDERLTWPAGIRTNITPADFTVRSFASYLPEISFTVDPAVEPGDYCFSAVSRTPSGGGEYAPFTLRVISSGS